MFTELVRKIRPLFWYLPGFLLWAAFPPMGERMDCLFALAPLMWLSRREVDAKIVAKRWFQSGIFFWIATLSWMPAIVKNGGPWPLVVLGWFALAAYCAAYFAAYGYLSVGIWRWARRGGYVSRLVSIVLLEPLLWCGLELVRSRFLGGFAWNQLGVVPVNSGFGAPAALGGVYLCSAVVILINGTIAGIAERVWKPERSGFANLKKWGSVETLLAFGVVFGLYQFSASLTSGKDSASPLGGTELKVAMVQRNFPCCFKAQEENPYEVYGRLLDNVAMLRPDLVVLPESAMCEFSPVDQQGAVRFAEWVREKTGAALLAGGSRYADGKIYNSAALYQLPATNYQLSVYDKVHLVPFGEFIPGDKMFPALQKLAPVGSCTPGEVKLLPFSCTSSDRAIEQSEQSNNPTILSGVAICFEDTDSALMREFCRMGAKVLFFITNDSWFSNSVEAEQHAWQAVARAIETGLPVVRVGNSGVTGTITPDGKATWLLGPGGRPLVDRQGTMMDKIEVSEDSRRKTEDGKDRTPTLYVLFGDLPLWIAFALLIIALILVKYRHRYE